MICQITIDNSNVITGWSIGGYIPNGIDIPQIPEFVITSCDCHKWCYTEEKGFYENPDYKPPDILSDLKEAKIAESKTKLAEWLANNPLLYSDGKYYSVTEEKQSLLNSNIASYERADALGVEYPLKWNSTGEECTEWTYESLVTLSLTIAAYVSPKVSKQQSIEITIKSCETAEELDKVVISYD